MATLYNNKKKKKKKKNRKSSMKPPPHRRKFLLKKELDIDMGKIPMDVAMKILKIIPEERVKDEEQIDTLATFLKEQATVKKFWKQYGHLYDELISKIIAKEIVLVDKPFKSSVIFNKDDDVDYYYFVLKGSVNIVAAFNKRSALSVVARIQEGEAFGSLGFLMKGGKRKAGAVTSTINTKLLAFPKQLFEKVLGLQIRKSHDRHYQIMRETKVFRNWDEDHLKRLAAITYDKTYMPGSHIALEGKNIDNRAFLYIVVQGEVEMMKSLSLKENGKQIVHNIKLATLGVNQVFCGSSLIKKGNVLQLKEKCLSDRGQFSHTTWAATYKAMIAVRVLILSRHGFFELANEQALQNLRKYAPPIPSLKMLRDTFIESNKWHKYKDQCKFPFLSLMEYIIHV